MPGCCSYLALSCCDDCLATMGELVRSLLPPIDRFGTAGSVTGSELGPGDDSASLVGAVLPRDEPSLVTLGGRRRLMPPILRGDEDNGDDTPAVTGVGDGLLAAPMFRGMRMTPIGAAAGVSFSSSTSEEDELVPSSSSSLDRELDKSIATRDDMATVASPAAAVVALDASSPSQS